MRKGNGGTGGSGDVCGTCHLKHLRGGKPEIYRLLAQKKHINISQIYTVLEQDGELLVVEEYVDGESLGEHLQKSPLSDERKINYALQLCEAVGFLHAMKPSVIHRDIKPSNILINSNNELKLIDFDAVRQCMYCLQKKMRLEECNACLYQMGEETLIKEDKT